MARHTQPTSFTIAQRVARRLEPDVRNAFLKAVGDWRRQLDDVALKAALVSAELAVIESAANLAAFPSLLANGDLLGSLQWTATLSGTMAADVLQDFVGLASQFNYRDQTAVLFAREQAGALIVQLGDDAREAVSIIVAVGQDVGLTVDNQARAIRQVVGIRPGYAQAPLRLGEEIRAGQTAAATSRRLSAADKQQIRSRIKAGTVDDAFVAKMEGRYADSLINRRAQDIARTETMRASNFGQRDSWRQAVGQEVLPQTVRRHPIVTPDDRLRESHAQVPGLNPDGRRLDEPYATPFGPLDGPPWEPNCRCTEGLVIPPVGAL